MNDDQRLQEQLERVTAAGRQMPAGLDDDSAALRKTWLALGDLLDQAAAGKDAESRPAVGDAHSDLKPDRPQRRSLTAIVALAASLLVGVGLATSYLIRQSGTAPESTVDLVAKQSPAAAVASDLQWDDPLDEEIGQAQQAAAVATSDWYAQSAAVGEFNDRIQRMQTEAGSGTF
jgi:hypothetical protein